MTAWMMAAAMIAARVTMSKAHSQIMYLTKGHRKEDQSVSLQPADGAWCLVKLSIYSTNFDDHIFHEHGHQNEDNYDHEMITNMTMMMALVMLLLILMMMMIMMMMTMWMAIIKDGRVHDSCTQANPKCPCHMIA